VRSAVDQADGLLVVGSSLAVHSAFRHVRAACQKGIPVAILNVGETRAEVEGLDVVKFEAPAGPTLAGVVGQIGQNKQQIQSPEVERIWDTSLITENANADCKGKAKDCGAVKELLQSTFPLDDDDNIAFVFGYGSGIFPQSLNSENKNKSSDKQNNKEEEDTTQNVMDVIIVVKDAYTFHSYNIQRNPSHYLIPSSLVSVVPSSSLVYNGNTNSTTARLCTWWQCYSPPSWLGLRNPGVYFFLPSTNDTIAEETTSSQPPPKLKYGVVQLSDLQKDLQDWTYLYLAGRMQKPTLTIVNNPGIQQFQHAYNLPAALATGLLLFPSSHEKATITQPSATATSVQVFEQITSLSYLGDFRMGIAEDPYKISRIVQGPGQVQRFSILYMEAIQRLQQQGILSIESGNDNSSAFTNTTTTWTWDTSPSAVNALWKYLPSQLPPVIQQQQQWNCGHKTAMMTNNLRQYLATQIVAPSARYQSLKGIVTAGPYKAWQYAVRKLSKGILRHGW
jgi:hypothetical protein